MLYDLKSKYLFKIIIIENIFNYYNNFDLGNNDFDLNDNRYNSDYYYNNERYKRKVLLIISSIIFSIII